MIIPGTIFVARIYLKQQMLIPVNVNLACKLAQRVACLQKTVKATIVVCRVREPPCTVTKSP